MLKWSFSSETIENKFWGLNDIISISQSAVFPQPGGHRHVLAQVIKPQKHMSGVWQQAAGKGSAIPKWLLYLHTAFLACVHLFMTRIQKNGGQKESLRLLGCAL